MLKPAALSLCVAIASAAVGMAQQNELVRVDLSYRAPGSGPAPNFSPKGTQIALAPLATAAALPAGATQPAKTGILRIGPDAKSYVPILATGDADHPNDFSRLFVDKNRNGRFDDDGAPFSAVPTQNEKTKAWWSSFNRIELSVPYGTTTEPYLINAWIVRDGDAPPDVMRFSVGSWRSGTANVHGVEALVAAMDSDNDALFGPKDTWSVLAASTPDAAKAVLTITEARGTERMMFVQDGDREWVLDFRSLSPDGRTMTFAVVDRPVTKAADRAGDDLFAAERPRPRTTTPFVWNHAFDKAVSESAATRRNVFIDFEATWCGPCKSMDQWVWTDADVAGILTANYVGVKLDGDIEKALVKRFNVVGYPTMIVIDPAGKELKRAVGYQSSAEILAMIGPKR